jgi:hypothetical protein
MKDINERVMELAIEKYCCAQIVMKIGLEFVHKENPDLIKAMKGLCYGLSSQHICGTLSSAACMLALYDANGLVPELSRRFEEKYGSVNCCDILGTGKINPTMCMKIVEETCAYCFEMLEDKGMMPEVFI